MLFGGDDGLAWTPSESILSIKSRTLKKAKQEKVAAPVADTEAETAPLVALYESHGGNLEAIFTELGDDPGKALKYPPKDAAEFAKKYLGGYYTYVNMQKIAAKISKKRAAQITEENFLEFLMKPPPPPRRDDAECSAKLASRQKQEADASDAMTQGLEKLYGDHSGNLEAIFDVLGEDPGKALKYPPKDAKGFATKYLAGGYTYVEVRKAPSKPKTAAALSNSGGGGGVDAMTQGFADLYTQHGGNLEAIFEVLGENPNKALKYPPSDAIDFATKYIAGNFTYAAGKAGRTGASGGSGSFDGKPGSPNGGKSSGGAAGGGSSDADPMVAALENLYGQHGGDLEAIFAQLGENPKKALKYPPADGAVFARKYLEGCYTYYTAPEESEASVSARMDAQDEALTPMEVLLMLFPDVEPALLEAAFQEANGHLEQTVELLLTAMFFSSLDTNAASMEGFQDPAGFLGGENAAANGGDGATPAAAYPPPPPGMSELAYNEFNDMYSNGEDLMDQVLALTVPPGATAGDLVRFVTPAGAIVAEVPHGVSEGQPFFVRLQPVA